MVVLKTKGINILGLIIVIIGILFLLNRFLYLNLPVFTISLGIFFVLLGTVFISKKCFHFGDTNNIILDHRSLEVSKESNEYSIIFSDGAVDLTKVDFIGGKRKLKINSIFSSGTVIISPQTPIIIKANSAFGCIHLPDMSDVIFGSKTYKLGDFSNNKFYIEIEANAVFGRLLFASMSSPPKNSNSEFV